MCLEIDLHYPKKNFITATRISFSTIKYKVTYEELSALNTNLNAKMKNNNGIFNIGIVF